LLFFQKHALELESRPAVKSISSFFQPNAMTSIKAEGHQSMGVVLDSPLSIVDSPPTLVYSPPALVGSPLSIVDSPPTLVYSPPALVDSPLSIVDSPPELMNSPPEDKNKPVHFSSWRRRKRQVFESDDSKKPQ
jgi:hypothetical protein